MLNGNVTGFAGRDAMFAANAAATADDFARLSKLLELSHRDFFFGTSTAVSALCIGKACF
jgi:hypothetical protein